MFGLKYICASIVIGRVVVVYVCFNCRMRAGPLHMLQLTVDIGKTCAQCHQKMVNVGFKCMVPQKHKVKEWKHLQKAWETQLQYVDGKETDIYGTCKIVKQAF